MAAPAVGAGRSSAGSPAVQESARLYRAAEEFESHHDTTRQVEALKAYVGYVETHRRNLEDAGDSLATQLDEVAMALYRQSQAELAGRAIDLGLAFAPQAPRLLHHKALILLTLNRNLEYILPLLDRALQASPHDRGIWATRGDALRLLRRPAEAADAYVQAQKLDPSSSQFVDRALKLVPEHPEALRLKLQLARATGGDRQALQACEQLLATRPEDPELLLVRAELLTSLGDLPTAAGLIESIRASRPSEPRVQLLYARLLFEQDRPREAIAELRRVLESPTPADPDSLLQVAQRLTQLPEERTLLLDLRRRVWELAPTNLANLREMGTLAVELGQGEVAVQASRALLEQSPGNLEAMRSLAELLLAAGRADEAFDQYRELARAHPREVSELRKAMLAAQSARRSAVVREFAQAILAVAPADSAARESLAQAFAEDGGLVESLAEYDRLLERSPTEVRYLLEKRRLLVELNRTDLLPRVYDEIFRLDPTRTDIALERGNLYLGRAYELPDGSTERAQMARSALVSYERASLSTERRASALLGLARASRLVHLPERAAHAYRDFLEMPGQAARADARKELGHVLRELHRYREAEAEYAQALAAGGDDLDLLWGEVEALTQLNQEEAALRYVELLLHREPQNPLFLRRKGQLLLQSGRQAEALPVLTQAVEAARGDPRAHFEVGEALRAHGAFAEAIPHFTAGLRLDPKSRSGWLALGGTLHDAGRYDEVIPIVDRLLHEDSNDLLAWRLRADAFRALQRPTDLQYSLRGILLLDPHNSGALLEMSHLQLAAGEKEAAYSGLLQVAQSGEASANDPALWMQIADLGSELGRTEEANRAFDRVTQLDPSRAGDITTRRARLRLAAGRPDLALELVLASSEATGPEAPVDRELLRAEILTALERPAEAQKVYEGLLARTPPESSALPGLARCLLEQGQPGPAREQLRAYLPRSAPESSLFLLLAEAESALGSLPEAAKVLEEGTRALPQSWELWGRLGELRVRQEQWPEAADAFAHAMALAPQNADLPLHAGFVAEKLGHEHEALALYEHATQIAGSNPQAWCSQGLALLRLGRPGEALEAFARALALDGNFEAALEGRKAAEQKTREATVEKYGRDALLLEAKLNRSVNRNDLFVTLHVPYDLLDPILSALARTPRMDLAKLSAEEMHDLESASCQLLTSAIDRRPEGIERRGLTLADVAVLSPPTFTLGELQRLFGYVRSVLDLELRPENLTLTPEVEELARRALALPEAQRTLFQLSKTLRVGLYKARVIKTVEAAGSAVHAPLPSVDLGQYSPEFKEVGAPAASLRSAEEEATPEPPFFPADDELVTEPITVAPPAAPVSSTSTTPDGSRRCLGCGGLPSVVHVCGAPLCGSCIHQFPSCPKCHQAVSKANSQSLTGHPGSRPKARPAPSRAVAAPSAPAAPARSTGVHPIRGLLNRARGSGGRGPDPRGAGGRPRPRALAEPAPEAELPELPEAPPAPPPRPPREKRDDEPRL
ncbi:MAG: tetratricopeptide repeat protein [Thermoplasmata archaeon]|nr:tetratricopeptide repeat protein [Thermoplasmata archaeon]